MPEEKTSGAVVSLAVIGLVAGIIGLLGSFIPCLGAFALYVSVPGAVVSGIALAIAKQQEAKIALPVAALTICLLGAAIAFYQYYKITNFAN